MLKLNLPKKNERSENSISGRSPRRVVIEGRRWLALRARLLPCILRSASAAGATSAWGGAGVGRGSDEDVVAKFEDDSGWRSTGTIVLSWAATSRTATSR